MNIIKPAIESNKGITEKTYLSISKSGNVAIKILADLEPYTKEGNRYDLCSKAYIKAKQDDIYGKVQKTIKEVNAKFEKDN